MNTKIPTYEELTSPLVPFSYPWVQWGLARVFLNTIGRLSQGVRLGYRYGFDSGQMLDYVYRNEAQGDLFLGKWIDRFHLNSPGWTGIRQRKVHLKQILREIITEYKKTGQKTVIMDLASGPGQYLIETIQENLEADFEVICRDLSEEGLEAGRKKVKELNLRRIRYEKADAFNPHDLQMANPQPNVVVVSGLYELFTDDSLIQQSMKNIARILHKGDYFIFTNQPFHPQLELIARVLPNRLGKPWAMRLRSDETVQGWATEAGFQPLKKLIDQEGIFSVICTQRRG